MNTAWNQSANVENSQQLILMKQFLITKNNIEKKHLKQSETCIFFILFFSCSKGRKALQHEK